MYAITQQGEIYEHKLQNNKNMQQAIRAEQRKQPKIRQNTLCCLRVVCLWG